MPVDTRHGVQSPCVLQFPFQDTGHHGTGTTGPGPQELLAAFIPIWLRPEVWFWDVQCDDRLLTPPGLPDNNNRTHLETLQSRLNEALQHYVSFIVNNRKHDIYLT